VYRMQEWWILYAFLHSIPTPPYCTLSYILSLLPHTVHNVIFYLYSSILYTILHSISTLALCTLSLHSNSTLQYGALSYIISLLFHTVHYFTLYLHTCILYTFLCTASNGRNKMYDSVQYGRVGIKCMI
jgi:hypothetical protein